MAQLFGIILYKHPTQKHSNNTRIETNLLYQKKYRKIAGALVEPEERRIDKDRQDDTIALP